MENIEHNAAQLATPSTGADTYNMAELAQPFKFQPHKARNKKEAMKAMGATSDDVWSVPVGRLRRIPQYNIRVKNADYYARRREYADSMKADGYFPYKPMIGYIGIDPETGDEVFYIISGNTRADSVELANSELPEDKQIEFVKGITVAVKDPNDPKSQGLDEDDLNAMLIRENRGAPLNAYEEAIACKRMADNGKSLADIAKKVNYSTEWVGNLLELSKAPIELQMMVADDVIKPTFAIEVIKQHGDKALAVLQAALARKIAATQAGGNSAPTASAAPAGDATPGGAVTATDTLTGEAEHQRGSGLEDATVIQSDPSATVAGTDGAAEPVDSAAAASKKVRLTAKDLESPEVRKFNNKVKNEAAALYQAAQAIKSDPKFDTLSSKSRETLLQVLAKLEQYEVKDEPAVDPRQTGLFADGASDASAKQNGTGTEKAT